MTPTEFKQVNVRFAEDQPEYQTLPAWRVPNVQGEVISCWELSDEELLKVNETKRIFLSQWTFFQALQPVLLSTELTAGEIGNRIGEKVLDALILNGVDGSMINKVLLIWEKSQSEGLTANEYREYAQECAKLVHEIFTIILGQVRAWTPPNSDTPMMGASY